MPSQSRLQNSPALSLQVAAAAFAALATTFAGCDLPQSILLEPRERVLRRLDSLDIARQQRRRMGAPLDDLERRITALRDSLNQATLSDSTGESLAQGRHTKPESPSPAAGPNTAMVAIVAVVCLAALLLVAAVLRVATRGTRTQPRRKKPQRRRGADPPPAQAAAAPTPAARPSEDPAVRMVRTRLRNPVVKQDETPRPQTVTGGDNRGREKPPPQPTRQPEPKKPVEPALPEPTTEAKPIRPPGEGADTPGRTRKPPEPPAASSNRHDRQSRNAAEEPPAPAARKLAPADAPRVVTGSPARPREQAPPKAASPAPPPKAPAPQPASEPQGKSPSKGIPSSDRTGAATRSALSPAAPPEPSPPPRPEPRVKDVKQQVLDAAESGQSPEQIARTFGLSPDHVRLILKVSGK